jgi:hypothetical protein
MPHMAAGLGQGPLRPQWVALGLIPDSELSRRAGKTRSRSREQPYISAQLVDAGLAIM